MARPTYLPTDLARQIKQQALVNVLPCLASNDMANSLKRYTMLATQGCARFGFSGNVLADFTHLIFGQFCGMTFIASAVRRDTSSPLFDHVSDVRQSIRFEEMTTSGIADAVDFVDSFALSQYAASIVTGVANKVRCGQCFAGCEFLGKTMSRAAFTVNDECSVSLRGGAPGPFQTPRGCNTGVLQESTLRIGFFDGSPSFGTAPRVTEVFLAIPHLADVATDVCPTSRADHRELTQVRASLRWTLTAVATKASDWIGSTLRVCAKRIAACSTRQDDGANPFDGGNIGMHRGASTSVVLSPVRCSTNDRASSHQFYHRRAA